MRTTATLSQVLARFITHTLEGTSKLDLIPEIQIPTLRLHLELEADNGGGRYDIKTKLPTSYTKYYLFIAELNRLLIMLFRSGKSMRTRHPSMLVGSVKA